MPPPKGAFQLRLTPLDCRIHSLRVPATPKVSYLHLISSSGREKSNVAFHWLWLDVVKEVGRAFTFGEG